MSRRWMLTVPVLAAAALAAGCASVPRDAGIGDVRRAVEERGGQRLGWDPAQPIEPPSSEPLRPLLAGELTAERAVEVAFANNRDLLATLEELGMARADLIAASTVRNPVFDGEVRFPGSPSRPFEIVLTQTLIDLFRLRQRRALGQAEFAAARLRVSGAVLGFAAEVRADYYTLQAAQQALAQQQTITAAAEAAAELARRQHDAGNVSDLDLEAEQARYEQAKLDHARVQLDELAARERLLADLGAPESMPLLLPPQAVPVPPEDAEAERSPEEVEAALSRRIDISLAAGGGRDGAPGAAAGAQRDLRRAGGRRASRARAGRRGHDRSRRDHPHPALRSRPGRAHARGRSAADGRAAAARADRDRPLRGPRGARAAGGGEGARRLPAHRNGAAPARILQLTQLEYNAMLRGPFDLIRARQELAGAEREQVLATRDYWLARTGDGGGDERRDRFLGASGADTHGEERR